MKVGKKFFILYIIDRLNIHVISQIIINTHFLPVHINKVLETRALYYHVPRLLGHQGTIFALREWLQDDFFFVLNGDTLSNINFTDMMNLKQEDEILAAMDENRAVWTWLYPPLYFKNTNLPIRPYRPTDLIWHDIGRIESLQAAREYYDNT